MHRNSDHVLEIGIRDTPYEEKSYVVKGFRRMWPERGDQDRSGPYGQGLMEFFTEGITKAKPFRHVVDVADIILIE
jgi:hypothetical protein